MPLPARSYVGLQVGRAGTLFALEAPPRRPAPGAAPGTTVHRYDLRQRRSDVARVGRAVLRGVGERREDADGAGGSLDAFRRPADAAGRRAATGRAGSRAARRLRAASGRRRASAPTDDIEVRSDPRVEWKQMYHDAWRIQREFFYDPEPPRPRPRRPRSRIRAVPRHRCMSRRDLNYVFADMMGEITVGHLGVGGGDVPETRTIATGLLGADYRDRERPLPLRAHLRRRELEPGPEGAADAARRERSGGRISAGRQRPRASARPTTSTASSRPPRARACCCASARTPMDPGAAR